MNRELAEIGKKTRIDSIKEVSLDFYKDERGDLTVAEEHSLPIKIARIFTVRAQQESNRANHAHKECSQLIFCVSGEIVVVCDDSFKKSTLILNNPSDGILVPPGIWLEQTYKENNSILNVICDLPYDPDDYISDYKEFEGFKL